MVLVEGVNARVTLKTLAARRGRGSMPMAYGWWPWAARRREVSVPGATDVSFTLRSALAHMLQETARHCGHLDLLRESIDGQVGE